MIYGVKIKQLVRHMDDRGDLMEILRDDDEMFIEFGQVYVSAVFPGIAKAWHCHEHQTDSFCVLRGNARIGLFDDRPDSPTCGETQSIVCGDLKPLAVQIPPLVWHGFAAVGAELALVLNVPNRHYDADAPDELRRPLEDPSIPFDWFSKGG